MASARPLRLTAAYREAMQRSLADHFFSSWEPDYLDTERGRGDLEAHVSGRMLDFHDRMLPWIAERFDLGGKSVLEIGCGTGSASVPTALAAGRVRAFDISPTSLRVARERARLLEANNLQLEELSPDWARSKNDALAFAEREGPVDVVFFIALLEHLTPDERIHALTAAWRALSPDGVLVIYETPNRLDCFDWHSFELPFFHALPDQLAIEYSTRTQRPAFAVSPAGDRVEHLYRLGRGVSYHEFELALGLETMTVLNDGYSRLLPQRQVLEHRDYQTALEGLFKKYLPHVPLGFTRPSLDLVIQKHSPPRERPARVSPLSKVDGWATEDARRLDSLTDLALQLARFAARNLREIAMQPSQLPQRLRSWRRRRIG